MRRSISLAVPFFALILSGLAPIAPADAAPVPSGSYLQSCQNVQFDGRNLEADCRKAGGGSRKTVLNFAACAPNAQIGNTNGQLACPGRSGGTILGDEVRGGASQDDNQGERFARPFVRPDGDRRPPRGSYMRECEVVDFDGRMLTAVCSRHNGEQVRSRINVHECEGADIGVEHGQLVCGQ